MIATMIDINTDTSRTREVVGLSRGGRPAQWTELDPEPVSRNPSRLASRSGTPNGQGRLGSANPARHLWYLALPRDAGSSRRPAGRQIALCALLPQLCVRAQTWQLPERSQRGRREVAEHYTRGDLSEAMRVGITSLGKATDAITSEDLCCSRRVPYWRPQGPPRLSSVDWT
jgi:hypothetical protein